MRGRRLEGGKADAAVVDDPLDDGASLAFFLGRRFFFFFELAFPATCTSWPSKAGGGGGGGRDDPTPATVPLFALFVVVVAVGVRIGEMFRERWVEGGSGDCAGTGGNLADDALDAASITVEDSDVDAAGGPLLPTFRRFSFTSTTKLSLPTRSRRSSAGLTCGGSCAAGVWR